MLIPSRVRRPIHKHAFEEALEAASQDDNASAAFDDLSSDREAGAQGGAHAGFVGEFLETEGYVGSGSLSDAYLADRDPGADRDAVDPMAAVELVERAIANGLDRRGLEVLRRKFAVRIHPDRVPKALRAAAVRAMSEINAKIDQALSQGAASTSE